MNEIVYRPKVNIQTLATGESTIWYTRYHYEHSYEYMTPDSDEVQQSYAMTIVKADKYSDSSPLFRMGYDLWLCVIDIVVLVFLRIPFLCWLSSRPNIDVVQHRKIIKRRASVEWEWECRGRCRQVSESVRGLLNE